MSGTAQDSAPRLGGMNREEVLLHAGAFLSSVGVLLVAPYLAVYLTRDLGWSNTAAGFVIGLSFCFTRAAGLASGWLCRRVPALTVMHSGNALRIVGYLLLLRDDATSTTAALVLTGAGAGLYFPAAKELLLRVVPEERQLRSLAVRNGAANLGAALGPLAGLLALHYDPRLMFVAAAAVFLSLTLSQLTMAGARSIAPPATGGAAPTLRLLRPLLVIAVVDGTAAILLESSLPQVVAGSGNNSALTFVFLANSIAVILLQPFALWTVGRGSRMVLPVAGAAMALGVLPFSLATSSVALWVGGAVAIAVAEVLVVLWLDDQVRHLPSPATAYGYLSLGDGLGGLGGATVSSWLVARTTGTGAVFANSLWVLAAGFLAAGALATVLPRHRAGPGTEVGNEQATERNKE